MSNTVIVVTPPGKTHTRKHIEFKPDRHSIVAGNLMDKKRGCQIGVIQRVYFDACHACGTIHAGPCPKPLEDL